jgi:ribosome assembly protein YihI (activator of Der GTPase)
MHKSLNGLIIHGSVLVVLSAQAPIEVPADSEPEPWPAIEFDGAPAQNKINLKVCPKSNKFKWELMLRGAEEPINMLTSHGFELAPDGCYFLEVRDQKYVQKYKNCRLVGELARYVTVNRKQVAPSVSIQNTQFCKRKPPPVGSATGICLVADEEIIKRGKEKVVEVTILSSQLLTLGLELPEFADSFVDASCECEMLSYEDQKTIAEKQCKLEALLPQSSQETALQKSLESCTKERIDSWAVTWAGSSCPSYSVENNKDGKLTCLARGKVKVPSLWTIRAHPVRVTHSLVVARCIDTKDELSVEFCFSEGSINRRVSFSGRDRQGTLSLQNSSINSKGCYSVSSSTLKDELKAK